VGVLYALRYLAAFTTATRVAALDPASNTAMVTNTGATVSPGNENTTAGSSGSGSDGGNNDKVGLLQLSRREGILNVVSSILFPAVSDNFCWVFLYRQMCMCVCVVDDLSVVL